MKKLILYPFVFCVLSSMVIVSCADPKTEPEVNKEEQQSPDLNTEEALRAANDSFYAALNAMFIGDMTGMNAIWSHSENISQMGPFGGRLTGWEHVGADFQKNADLKFGGSIACQDLRAYVGNGMGYTTCVEEGQNLDSAGNLMKVRHRATNVFELQDGAWKMVHHHTDLSHQLEDSYKEAVNEKVE